jgi:hypothetical protein
MGDYIEGYQVDRNHDGIVERGEVALLRKQIDSEFPLHAYREVEERIHEFRQRVKGGQIVPHTEVKAASEHAFGGKIYFDFEELPKTEIRQGVTRIAKAVHEKEDNSIPEELLWAKRKRSENHVEEWLERIEGKIVRDWELRQLEYNDAAKHGESWLALVESKFNGLIGDLDAIEGK